MEAFEKFQSTKPLAHEDAIKAAASAAHCMIAPEGVCPAYTVLRKISAAPDISPHEMRDQALAEIHGCASARISTCPALELLENIE